MKPFFTCYIEQSGDRFEAACVDFDISVSAGSLDEVKASLETAVRIYLNTVFDEAEPSRSQLLTRRAPWLVRTKWRLKLLGTLLWRPPDSKFFEGMYSLPCPA